MSSIKCSNGSTHYHNSVAESRACWGVSLRVEDERLEQFKASTEAPQQESLAEINAEQETWPWAARKGRDPHPFDLGRRYAEAMAEEGLKPDETTDTMSVTFQAPRAESTGREENTERHYTPSLGQLGYAHVDHATDPQKNFLNVLLRERDWTTDNLPGDAFERAMDFMGEKDITKREAIELISALKTLPKRKAQEPREQPWRKLSREVPAGYYATTDAEGKNHFYRVSVGRNGFFKIQEQASSELHFVSLNRYEGILSAILETGLAEAGRKYATERSRCYRCNRELTDNTGNPYFVMGLGPECGGK